MQFKIIFLIIDYSVSLVLILVEFKEILLLLRRSLIILQGQWRHFKVASHLLLHEHTPLLFHPLFLLQFAFVVFCLKLVVLPHPSDPLLLKNDF